MKSFCSVILEDDILLSIDSPDVVFRMELLAKAIISATKEVRPHILEVLIVDPRG